MHRFQHILVPTDFEESADRAVTLATSLACAVGARITLAHVFTVEAFGFGHGAPLSLETMLEEARRALRDQVAEIDARGVQAEGLLLLGDATSEILAAIDSLEADLVVMGTHGRGDRPRLLLGSVTEEVVRRSKVPALTASSEVRTYDDLRYSGRVLHDSSRYRPSDLPMTGRTQTSWMPAND